MAAIADVPQIGDSLDSSDLSEIRRVSESPDHRPVNLLPGVHWSRENLRNEIFVPEQLKQLWSERIESNRNAV